MAEFEEGAMSQIHNSKASFASEMEFINSQLIRKDGDDDLVHHHHAYDHNMSAFSSHLHMIPPVNFTDQMSFFQSDHHHELSAASEPTVHPLGFGGGDFTSHESKKGKSSLPMSSEQLFNFASPSASDGTGFDKMELGAGKKRKRNNNAVEKPKEVVHVRAKRGQATDSHSLAERVRREKINERLRCLQDLVPGCYKTMGMAVMLDVISNYVRSLQNQIEFLSMKLSAASMYNELNFLEMAMDTMQRTEHQGADA